MRSVSRFFAALFAVAAFGAPMFGAMPLRAESPPLVPCVGDCNGSGDVTVDEIIVLVNIGLGTAAVDSCLAGDSDASGSVTVDEIVTAVNIALVGCTDDPAPTATPTPEITVEPTATPTATPTFGGPLGTRRFVLDPARSNFKGVLAPGFEVTLGSFRGQNDGVPGEAFLEFEAGAPDENGIAVVNITDASDYIVAQAGIANLTVCLKPLVPVASAGAISCNGGLDYSIQTSVDRVIGQIGEDGFTAADCAAAGGSIEGANQVCGEGAVGLECFVNADCDTASGSGDGVCGLATGTCPGNPLNPGAPCNSDADCEGARCIPVRCTAGKVGETCRNAGDCDTTPTSEDGVCGEPAGNPGGCQGTFVAGQIGENSGAGAVVFAPFEQFGLQGLPLQLNFEQALPCGDEGNGPTQAFALTTGTSQTVIYNFNAGPTDLVFTQQGENFDCRNWANGSGGRFGLSIPALGANPTGAGGDLIIGFTFQGK